MKFVGLPAAVVIGKREIFRLDYAIEGSPRGKAHVVMTDESGEAFFDAYMEPILDDAWVRLDLGDRWVTVTATAVEEHLDGSSCTRTISQRVDPITRIYAPSRCFNQRVRPRSMIVACGDGNLQLRRLGWRGWNKARGVQRRTGAASFPCRMYDLG